MNTFTPACLDTPNLDAMSTAELIAFAQAFENLAQYARTKSAAQVHRVHGRIDLALRLEKHCDVIYRELPSSIVW